MPQTLYTEEEFKEMSGKYSYSAALLKGCLRYFTDLDKISDKKNKSASEKARFPFIPSDINRTLDQLIFVLKKFGRRKRLKFVDAGCGIGWVVAVANIMGFDSYGYELESKNVEIAKHLFREYCCPNRFIRGDILRQDFSKYDVIYYYRPMHEDPKNLEKKFERKVEDEMKGGAVLIANLKGDDKIEHDKRFKRTGYNGGSIWVKKHERN